MRGSRGGGGSGDPDPLPPEKSQKYSFLAILVRNPEKSQSYQTRFQYWADIDMPAKRHLNGVSLAGR